MIGKSEAFLEIMKLISKIAAFDAPVLIEGETGTGKELTRLRLRPTRCIISHRHSKRATRCSDTSPRTINITARSAERIADSLSGPRPFKATIVAVS